MPQAKRKLQDLDIREIALCPRGMHPGAHILLYKAQETVEKQEGEPRSFNDHLQSERIQEIDEALDRRLYALLHTTTEIMRTDVDDREARILDAVEAYADAMKRDVPELFAGRLAKWLSEMAAEGQPSDDDLHQVVKSELGLAGLLPEVPSGGEHMAEFLKSLSERGQVALKYLLGGRDAEEFFKGTPEGPAKLVVGLVDKAAEWGSRIDQLEADLEKASGDKPDPSNLESILKAVEDPGVRTYIEVQHAALKKVSADLVEIKKEALHKEHLVLVKSLECLPNEKDSLLQAVEKADEAGILEPIRKALESANRQARIGKAMAELGVETIPGEVAGVSTPEEAIEALMQKGQEFRKADSTLTAEDAFEKACEENPGLYQLTRKPAVAIEVN